MYKKLDVKVASVTTVHLSGIATKVQNRLSAKKRCENVYASFGSGRKRPPLFQDLSRGVLSRVLLNLSLFNEAAMA